MVYDMVKCVCVNDTKNKVVVQRTIKGIIHILECASINSLSYYMVYDMVVYNNKVVVQRNMNIPPLALSTISHHLGWNGMDDL